MKILLDESLPRKLRNDFGAEHEVWTVRDKGWLGKKNGELLKLMVADFFNLFVTVDRNLSYQQNIEHLPLTIIVLSALDNRRETLKELIPKLFDRLAKGDLPKVITISL
jgi:predicted nuclease of predicted toxin-antitoxin system